MRPMENLRNNQVFISPSKGELSLAQMVTELTTFMAEEPDAGYSLVIGTDSKTNGVVTKKPVDFVSAVVIHRKGRGGRYFWQKNRLKKVGGLRQKIYSETLLSLDLAQELLPCLQKLISQEKYDLEIHIDVGEVGPTREMIKEVVGMVTGNGFTAKTKPESYGAFVVADKHT